MMPSVTLNDVKTRHLEFRVYFVQHFEFRVNFAIPCVLTVIRSLGLIILSLGLNISAETLCF